MKVAITKMYKQNREGDLIEVDITLARETGQIRALTGKIGSPGSSDRFVTEVKGSGKLIVSVPAGTVLHMHPVEG